MRSRSSRCKKSPHTRTTSASILHEHLDMERMMVRQEAAARLAMRSSESKDEDIPWQEAAFALQRKSERKRALDTLLDAAAQDFAAHKDEIEHFIEEGPRGDIVEKATHATRRAAQKARSGGGARAPTPAKRNWPHDEP